MQDTKPKKQLKCTNDNCRNTRMPGCALCEKCRDALKKERERQHLTGRSQVTKALCDYDD